MVQSIKTARGKDVTLWQTAGFAVVSALGTLLHFWYDARGGLLAALFSSVNESTWEHMKLIFFPMLLFALVENRFIGGKYECFLCVKLKGTLLGIVLIPVVFYTLRGAFGGTPDWINVLIFFVSAALSFIYETKELKRGSPSGGSSRLAIAAFLVIALAFFAFTFITPEIPLFRDPVDGRYGA